MSEPKRLLIVDDDPGLARMLKVNLEGAGAFEVRVETTASTAFSAAREFMPHLILLDVMMPGMDGGEVAAKIHGSRALKDVPIVFLTAAVQPQEIKSRGGVIGGYPYLAKPVELDTLLACIEKHIGK